ncbi:MAG: DivIVA domain-containing protein, partial [Gaiellales bacterium]
MNRQFSLGARGYNQDEVDSFLHEVAERMWAADADPSALADRLAGPRFSVVTLGYSRNEVHQYMDDLRVLLRRRAERQSTAHAPAEDTVEVSAPEEAEVEAAELEFVEDEVAASASTDEPAEVVYANGDGSHRGAHRARNPEVDETVAE